MAKGVVEVRGQDVEVREDTAKDTADPLGHHIIIAFAAIVAILSWLEYSQERPSSRGRQTRPSQIVRHSKGEVMNIKVIKRAERESLGQQQTPNDKAEPKCRRIKKAVESRSQTLERSKAESRISFEHLLLATENPST